jgi:Na+/melibiose symporter-like transporter
MSSLHISQDAAQAVVAMHLGKWLLLAAILGMVIVLGFFLPPVSIILMTAPIVLPPLRAAGFDLMIRAMLADVGDEVRLDQGKERISLIYALNTLAAKIASAFAIGITFPLLARFGYDATKHGANTPEAIQALELSYIVGPIVFVMLGGACVIGWRLDAEKHAEIRRQLDHRDAQYDEAPILESLAGEPAHVVMPGSKATD